MVDWCVEALSRRISHSSSFIPISSWIKSFNFFKNSLNRFPVTVSLEAAAKTVPADVIAAITETEFENHTFLTIHSFPFSNQE